MPKQIKDPVHGYIEVPDELIPLLDAESVQRLHYIRQLGFSYLVYPGANHTRFEHSLGAMHLASAVCKNLALNAEDTRLVCIAALLHDIGHGPYSHASERLCQEYGAFSHDNILPLLDPLKKILAELGTDPAEIAGIVAGHHFLASIIHGDLDVDRMDYLQRDAHYTGVPYGNIDTGRLIQSLVLRKTGGLVLKESGTPAAESLLIARTLMGPSVYYHHVGRIAEEMFLLACRHHFTTRNVYGFMRMDDLSATMLLHTSDSAVTRELMNRIRSRRLYKRAVYAGRDLVDMPRMLRLRGSGIERLKNEIAESAGVEEHQVILDIPPLRKEMHMQVQVQNRHDLIPFEELVPLLSLMNKTRQEQWRLGVYTDAENRERVASAAADVLGVQKPTKQHKLSELINE